MTPVGERDVEPAEESADRAEDPQRDDTPEPGRHRSAEDRPRLPLLVRSMLFVVSVIVLIALMRNFLLQTFVIPSASMEDTLVEGDRVAVTIYDSDDVERGDIIVFRDPDRWLTVTSPTGVDAVVQDVLVTLRMLPADPGHHLIKRVIGLPGDHVVAQADGTLRVNGVALDEPYVKPGQVSSQIVFDVHVPENCLWVMGDNRANSSDSRYHREDLHGGCVPQANVIGVAKAVVWPLDRWTGLSGAHTTFADVPSARPGTAPASGGDGDADPAGGGQPPAPGPTDPGAVPTLAG